MLFPTGYITKCFPTEEAKVQVQAVLHILGTILLEQNGKWMIFFLIYTLYWFDIQVTMHRDKFL